MGRGMRGIVLNLAAVVVVAACGPATNAVAMKGSPTASAKAVVKAGRSGSTASPKPTSGGTASTGSKSSSTGSTTTRPKVGGVIVTQPGTYTYTTSSTTSGGSTTGGSSAPSSNTTTATQTIADAAPVSGALYHQTITIKTGSASGGSTVEDLLWESSGVYLDDVKSSFGDCQFKPAVLLLRLPIQVGASWTDTESCSYTYNGQTDTQKTTINLKVTGMATVTIGGTPISTYAIATSGTSSGSFAGQSVTGTTTGTTWFAPSVGLDVKSYTDSKGSSATTSYESKATTELTSLKPA